MQRLSENDLQALPAEVVRPAYDRSAAGVGIVHLGIGAFHRAHQAVYTDDVMNLDGGSWSIVGVSLRSAGVRDQLQPQDGLYTVVEQSAAGERYRLIGAVKDVLVAPEDPAQVISVMANPQTRVVSLTITEKGYCHDPATGELRLDHPDIEHDLANIQSPKTAIGFIVAALKQRFQDGTAPFTVLTCDNLPSNGALLKKMVLSFARALDQDLAAQVEREVAFPSTMVDRIVPATTPEDRDALEGKLQRRDDAMVKAEPFRQWVIEDHFVNQRPAWEKAGALLVADVQVFEEMKLRLLNGSHSALAYLGYLAGYDYVYQTMEDAAFVDFIRKMMNEEVTPGLEPPPGIDLAHYKSTLIERFSNPTLKHRTWQIAMDGSQKLPQRLLNAVRFRLRQGASIDCLGLAVAGWMRYVTGVDEQGETIDVQDPLSARLQEIAKECDCQPAALVDKYLALGEVFGDLAGNTELAEVLQGHLAALYEHGARAAVKRLVAESDS